MAGPNRDVVLTLVGNDRVSRVFRTAGRAADGFASRMDKSTARVRSASFKAAAGILAINSAASLGGGAIAIFAGALAALPIALAGIGLAGAAMDERVQKAFGNLKTRATATLKDIGKPLVGPLVRGAQSLGRAFESVAPYLKQISAAAAPLVDKFFAKVEEFADKIGPKLPGMFANAIPVVKGFASLFGQVGAAIGRFFGDGSLLDGNGLQSALTDIGAAIGGFLDRVRRVGAVLAPFISQLVSGLKPVISAVVAAFDALLQKLQPVADWFAKHPSIIKAVGTAIGIVTVALTAFSVVMAVVNAVMLLSPFTWIVIGITALIAVIILCVKHWDVIKAAMARLWTWIKGVFGAAWDWLKAKVVAAVNGIKNGAARAWAAVKASAGSLIAWFRALPGRIVKAIGNLAKLLLNKGKDILRGMLEGVKWLWSHSLVGFLIGRRAAIVRAIGNVGRALFQKGKDIFNGLKQGLTWVWNNVIRPYLRIGSRVRSAVGNLGRSLYSAGRDLLGGMIDGVRSMASSLISAVTGPVGNAIDGAKSLLGIRSPSRVFKEIGKFTMQGFAAGVEKYADVARSAAVDALNPDGIRMDLSTAPVAATPAASGHDINIAIQSGVGDPVAIGREVAKVLGAYVSAGGRVRTS